jgi:hypothetical protein
VIPAGMRILTARPRILPLPSDGGRAGVRV